MARDELHVSERQGPRFSVGEEFRDETDETYVTGDTNETDKTNLTGETDVTVDTGETDNNDVSAEDDGEVFERRKRAEALVQFKRLKDDAHAISA